MQHAQWQALTGGPRSTALEPQIVVVPDNI